MLFLVAYTKVCDKCMCVEDNRSERQGLSFYECKERCTSDATCKGIEYWSGSETTSNNPSKICFKCLNPESTSSFTYKSDTGFPPSVYKKGITSLMQ